VSFKSGMEERGWYGGGDGDMMNEVYEVDGMKQEDLFQRVGDA